MDARIIDLDSTPVGWGRPVVTIGNFDGLHVGHQTIIADCLQRARGAGQVPVVVTFDPHPARVINPDAPFCQLKILKQRLAAFERLDVHHVALIRFDPEMRGCAARRFVERMLVEILAASVVLVGPSFRFGHKRVGDFALLQQLGAEHDFQAHAFTPVVDDMGPISSTRIRVALAAGDLELATRLLGRPFRSWATVVRGAGRGRGLGFATANAQVDGTCLPSPGVYATRVEVRGATLRGATFIGEPQTFGATERVFETHLLDWPGDDLYGEQIKVEFLFRLRDPRKFPSPTELVAQLKRDVDETRQRVALPGGGVANSTGDSIRLGSNPDYPQFSSESIG